MNIEVAKIAQKPDYIATLKAMEVGKVKLLKNVGTSIASIRNAAWRLQKSDEMVFSITSNAKTNTVTVERKK